MKRPIIFILVIVIILFVYGVYLYANKESGKVLAPNYNNPAPTAPISETPSSVKEKSAGQFVVVYTDQGYSPENLEVKVGATVVFQNNSSEAMWTASGVHPSHRDYSGTSLSEHCANPDNNAFDACGGTQPGQAWSFQFNKVGVWEYHNHLNPFRAGTITVNP